MDLCISILLFTILSIQNEINFVNCREFTILDQRNTHIDITHHGLVTVDIKKLYSTHELAYKYNPSDDSKTFTPNQGYLINKVTKRDAVLWDARDYGNVYSDKVFVGFNQNHERVFRVYFPGEPPRLSVFEPPKPLEPLLITLDVKTQRNTDQVLYEYNVRDQVHTFTPLPRFLVDRVVKGRRQLWECEDGVYPEKIMIIPDQYGEPTLRFKFPKSGSKGVRNESLLEKSSNNDYESESNNDYELVNLNIAVNKSTDKFEYAKKREYVIYTANDNYAFKLVNDNKIEIWKADEEKEYATKVMAADNKVLIYIGEGTSACTKVFNKGSDGNWKEDTSGMGTGSDGTGAGTTGYYIQTHCHRNLTGRLYGIDLSGRGMTAGLQYDPGMISAGDD
ncbi:uncharacterized protein TOT_020000837 [Theileria orientalis strain Shintoku]|uniref:SfiI-subtelomeric related protein family member n=1 Tax=Theileria orientalis strain Shintoku TaxID=869250 RepID=J4CD61_THEOR|nr:uncharacterized protein TOT_020000837 [Theileria orientalis strain Shintoku]BAM40582.1 uncharacterized protein TOT_020000837 [Theileria orientalis strain Shintoku]|eukprot:XP_009690883.1 uncharacterized protein TOT_020000837 [Theileria orientalis strain Shintoku]